MGEPVTDWSDIIRRMSAVADELAVERIRDNPASSALAELRNQPVQGPGANRPMSFKDFRQSSEYDQAPLEQQQALYDTFLQTQLPRFIPKGASEDQRYDVLARFSKENPRPRQPGIFEAFTGGFSRGMESLGVGNAATLGQSPESIAGELRDVAMARPPSASERDARAELAEAARRFNEAKGFANSSYAALQAVGTLLGNGRETVSMLGESLGASIPAFGGAAGGAAVAGPVGMIVGLVAGNAATNVQSNIAQELQEKIAGAGIDMRDQVAVAQVLREHPEWVSDSLVRGTKSGLATAAVESAIDIATFGVSKVARPAVKAGQVALRAGSAVAAQGLAEGAGAIAGEVAVGDAPNYGDALIQGALGTIGGIPDAAIDIGAGAGARPAPPVPVKPDVRVFDDETAPEPAEPASPPLLMLPPPDRKPIIASATGLAGTDADAVERAALAERYAPQPILEDVLTGLVPNGVIDEQAGTATDAAGQPVPGDAAGSTAGGAPGDRPADAATGPEPGRFVSVDDVDGIEAILERIDRAAGNRADSGGADPGVPGDATATATGDAPTDRPADAAGSGFVSIDDTDGLEAALDRIERLATGGIPADRGNPAGRPAIGPAPAGNGGAVGDQTGGVPGSGQQATGPGDRDGGAGDQPSDAPAPVDRPPPRPPQAGPTVVLQNRDRSSASSVAQMSAIAGNPDYLRLSPTRLLSEGAPVVIDEAAVPDAQIGIEDTAVDAQGDKVPIRYAVVEADALLTSHDAQGNPVDGYANGVPGRLRAVAGNGRIAGLQEGYKRGTTTAYVEALARDERATGISAQTIARFKRPVLVRLMRGQDVTSDIGDRTNTSGVSSLSPLEQAANDARRVRLDALEFDDNGAPTPDTIRRFIQGMPQSEQSGLIGKSGEPTRQAVDRLMNAVFHSAYRDDEIVNLFAAATDAEARNVINALAAIAPEANRLEGAGDLDVRPLIVDAAKMAVNARRRGIKLLDMVEQEDITVDHATQEVARIMAEHARSTRAMTDRLRHLIGMAYKASQQGDEDLLGAVPKPSVLRLIEEANQPEAQLFSRVSEPTEPGMTAAAVGQLVSKMLANWASPPGINVVPTLMHSAVPAEVREAAARNAATQAEGFFWDGRVWLVADQLPTANDVLRVTLHESLGHFGLRRTFGQRLDPILRAVIRDHRAAVERRTRDEGLAIDDERNLMIGAEEHLAYLAQTAPENRLVSRAISAIREVVRQIARAMGADLRLTDADIINSILAPARRNIIEGAGRADADDSISGHGNRQPAMARVFHGTPYRGIEKFDTDMIGAGEGAQAYGWGLYFASKKEVADHYRDVLSKRFGASITKNGKELFEADLAQAYFRIGEIKRDRSGQLYKVLAFNRDDRNRWSVDVQSVGDDGVALRGERVRNHATMPRSEDLERDLSARGYEVSHGQLYEVEIPEDSEMLLWDRPINEQPEKTRSALESLIGSADLASWTGEDAYRRIVKVTGGGQKGASMALARFGVKGIKYLDGASRAARDGSHNYVIFSGDDAKIERSLFSRRAKRRTDKGVTSGANLPKINPFSPGQIPVLSRRAGKADAAIVKAALAQKFQLELFGPDTDLPAATRTWPDGVPGDAQPAAQVPKGPPPLVTLRRVGTMPVMDGPIDSAEAAATAFADLRRSPRERINVLALDADNRPIAMHRLFLGTIDAAAFNVREMFMSLAQTDGVASFWMAHNHPSGLAHPSRADHNLTDNLRRKYQAGPTGVALAGHIIIAGRSYVHLAPDGSRVGVAQIKPVRRKVSLPIVERVTVRTPDWSENVSSPDAARVMAKTAFPDRGAGVMALSTQHKLVGTFPMQPNQMASMGDTYRDLIKFMAERNAAAAIVVAHDEEAANNVASSLDNAGLRVLYGVIAREDGSHTSMADSGSIKPKPSFFSRRPSQVRAPDDPRRTDNFASNQEVMRFAATLRLPPRTLGDVAINERDPIKAARLFGRQAVDRLADTFADAMLPAQRWIERMPVSTEAQRQIIGGLRRAHGIRGSLDRQVDERFGRPMRREIRKLAKQYGMGTDEAMQAVGYWMTANYVPRQNAWLADKDQMAISELQAEQQAAAAAVAQARAQGVTTPALDQQLKAADDALNAATAKAAKRLAEINDPRLGRTEFKIGVSAGMTNAQAAYTKQLIESRIPEAQIRRVAQMGWDLMAWRTQQDLKSGKLTAQMLATWPNHPEYVPTTGDPREEDFEDLVTNVRGGSSLNVPKDKAVGGRTSSVSQDGISAMFDAVGRSINHAAYQDFKRGLSAAYDEAIVDATNELAGSGFSGSQLQIEIRRLAERNLGMAKVNGEPNVGTAKDAIIYRDGGKSAQFLIADPTVTEAIRRENLDRTPTVLQKLFEPGSRIFARLVTTLNPMFAPMNSFRDIWERSELLRAKTIYDQSGNKVNVARAARAALRMMYDPRNVHASIRKAFGRDFTSSQGRDLEEMIELGGLSTWGGYLAKGRQQIADQLRKESMPIIGGKTGDQARALFQLVEGYNQSFDLLSSLAVYRALLAEGVAKEEAAAQTLDLMDFRKTGKAMFPIKAMFVFAQPIVTGGANLIGQLNTRVGRQRFLAYTMLSYGLYSLLKMLDEDNDDEGGSRIDQLGAWTTERSIPIPINESTIFKIPIGFGLPQLAWGTAVHLTRLMSGESTPVEASAELLKTMGKTISPLQPSEISVAEYPMVYAVQTFAPTILKPFAQLATDRNAFGNRITPTFPKQNTLKAEQPKLSTPDIYTDAAVWMQRNMGFDVYPEQIRTVATGLLVGPFRELFFKPFVDNPAREKMGRDTVPPYVSTFIAPFNEWSTIVRGREAYDHLQALAAEKESRTDRGEAIDQWMTPLRRRQLTLYDEWTDAERDVRNEKARATRAFNKGNITEAVRDARYKTATERRDQATARFLYRYRQIIGKPTTRSLRRGGELSE